MNVFLLQIMATDGCWDVLENETVARITFETLKKYPNEKHRYTMVAQELVAKSRGRANDSGHWRLSDLKAPATVDDISVIVIPVYQYYKDFCEWEKKYFEAQQKREEMRNSSKQQQATASAGGLLSNVSNGDVDDEVEEAKEDNSTPDDDDEDDEEEVSNELDKAIEKFILNDGKDEEPTESTA
jgi:protein phosphatase 1H